MVCQVVSAQSDEPVEGAAVVAEWFHDDGAIEARDDPRAVMRATSGPGGMVTFDGIGTCRVRVEDRWVYTVDAYYEAEPWSGIVRLEVYTGGRIEGRVVDQDGHSVSGAVLRARVCSGAGGEPWWVDGSEWCEAARTDERGRYSLPPAGDLTLAIRADHPAFAPSSIVMVPVRPGEVTEAPDLVLERGIPLLFLVRGPHGEPIPTARLLLRDPKAPSFVSGVELEGETNDRGEMMVERWGGEEIDVSAGAPGYAPVRRDFIEVATTPILIRLERGQTMEGRVLSDAGLPLGGRHVSARPTDSRDLLFQDFSFEATTDGEGRFRITDLPSGSFLVWTPGAEEVRAPAGSSDVELIIRPPPNGIVRGRVLDARTGAPIQARLELLRVLPGGRLLAVSPRPEVRCDPEGFEIVNAPAGAYEIVAEASGYIQAVSPVEIDDDRPVEGIEIAMEPMPLVEGTVRDSATGQPIGGTVYVENDRAFANHPSSGTNPEGTFSLRAEPGPSTLRVAHTDYVEATERIDVAQGMEAVQIRLGRGSCLEGQVTLEGRPLGEDEAHVCVVEPSYRTCHGAMTGGDGGYHLCGLLPGTATVVCTITESLQTPFLQGRFLQEIEVPEEKTVHLDIDVAAGGEIHGQLGTSERPLAFAEVTVERVSPDVEVAEVRADRDGHYEVQGLVDGTYRVSASLLSGLFPDLWTLSRICEISGGRSVRVDLFSGETQVLFEILDETGNPTVPDEVELRGSEGEARGFAARVFPERSTFRVRGLPQGTFWLSVEGDGGSARQQWTLDGEARLAVRLTQDPPGAALKVAVLGPEGRRTRGTFLLVPARLGAPPIPYWAETIPPGVYDLYVGARGLAPRKLGPIQIRAGQERRIEASLDEGSTLLVDIGQPFPPRTQVAIRNDEGVDLAPLCSPYRRTSVYHLPAGSYRVTVELEDGRRGEGRVDVGQGQTARLKLTLQ